MKPREDLLRESLLVYLRRGSLGLPVKGFQFLGRVAPRIQRVLHDFVCDRIFASGREVECPVVSFSDVIDENGLERIDLLKLDVEGAELEVLTGVRAEHWPRIHAVTAEVEDVDGALDAFTRLLEANGLCASTRQAPEMAGTPFHLVWATRKRDPSAAR